MITLGIRQATMELPSVLEPEKEQLQALYGNIKNAEDRLKELEGQRATMEDLSVEIVSLQKELAILKASKREEIRALEEQYASLMKSYAEDKVAKGKELEALEVQLSSRRQELKDVSDEIGHRIAVGNKDVEKLITKHVDLETQIKQLEQRGMSGKVILSDLEQKTARAQEISKVVSNELKSGQETVAQLRSQIEELKIQEKDASDKLFSTVEALKEAEKKLLSVEKEIANKGEGLVRREGEVSVREKLMEEKKEQLLRAKKQLEEYFNKPLHNLIV